MGTVRLAREGIPPPTASAASARSRTSASASRKRSSARPALPHDLPGRPRRSADARSSRGGPLRAARAGTRVVWRCRFESRIPGLGGVFQALITRFFRNALASPRASPSRHGAARIGPWRRPSMKTEPRASCSRRPRFPGRPSAGHGGRLLLLRWSRARSSADLSGAEVARCGEAPVGDRFSPRRPDARRIDGGPKGLAARRRGAPRPCGRRRAGAPSI